MAGNNAGDDKDQTSGSEENFGLPDIEYKPLEETAAKAADQGSESSTPPPPSGSFDSYSVDDSKSKAPVVLTVVIILVLAIAGYLMYNFVYKPGAEEKAKKELAAKQEAQRKKEEADRIAREKAAEEQRKRDEALANAKPATGTIEVLNDRTRRYYVVVTSDIDDDLLMDYARKLSASGVSTKVIPPFGGKKFYRLAIADHETFALAQTSADASKGTYGAGVWVLKY